MTTDSDASLQILQAEVATMIDRYDRDRDDRKEFEAEITSSIREMSQAISKIDVYQAEQNNINDRMTTLDSHISTQSEQIRDLQINQAGLIDMRDNAKTIKNTMIGFVITAILGGTFVGYNQVNKQQNESATDKLIIKLIENMDKSPN
jgi:chromosome segregation ATPase